MRSPALFRARPHDYSRAVGALLIALVAACRDGGGTTTTDPDVTNSRCIVSAVAVSPVQGILKVGGDMSLNASVTQTGCSNIAPTWSTSNPDVLRVSSGGTLTAIAPGGPVVVSARVGTVSGSGAFVVEAATAAVASVTVSPAGPLALTPGQTAQLAATARDASGASLVGRTVTWSSSNAAVANVSSAGLVTAAVAGQATVTATSEGRTGSASVIVSAPTRVPVASVSITPAAITLVAGQSAQLVATMRDASGALLTGRTVSWTTSNVAVAAVSGTGAVSAVGTGQATLTATSEGRSASASVSVSAPTPPPVRQVTLEIDNQLIYPVNISVAGTVVGSVPAQSTRSTTVNAAASMRVAFDLVRPTLGGRALGDPVSGYWDLTNPTATVTLTVDNLVGTQWYFAPIVTNTSGRSLLMAVNWELQSENRCNCTVPATGAPTQFGYYRLYNNSILAAFRDGSNYTGAYRFFSDFGSGVPRGSGRTTFTFSTAP